MSRFGKHVLVAGFVAWIAIPLVLIGIGIQSGFSALEQRPATQLPRLSAGALVDPRLYSEVADAFADRVPLRAEALALDTWFDLNIFRDSPNPAVLMGTDGWLFHRQSVVGPRRPEAAQEAVSTLRKLSRILAASGRQLVLLVAPTKDAIYPEYLGPSEGLAQPGREARQRVRTLLQQAELPGYIDLWQALEELKATTDEAIYWRHDTHWTSKSVVEVSRQVVDLLDPTLWDETAIRVQHNQRYRGDLARMTGLPTWDHGTLYSVQREVQVEQANQQGSRGVQFSTTGSQARLRRRVLGVYDSFGEKWLEMLPQYFDDSTWIAWSELPKERLRSIAAELASADVLVLETAERALIGRFSTRARGLSGHLVGQLLDELPVIDLVPLTQAASSKLAPIEISLRAAAVDVDRYFVAKLGLSTHASSAHTIRLDARGLNGTWHHTPRHVLESPRGGWVVVAPLSMTARAVRIQPTMLNVGSFGLVELGDPSG